MNPSRNSVTHPPSKGFSSFSVAFMAANISTSSRPFRALHRLFPALNPFDLPFGQDCTGDRFILRDGVVHRLSGEAGGRTNTRSRQLSTIAADGQFRVRPTE